MIIIFKKDKHNFLFFLWLFYFYFYLKKKIEIKDLIFEATIFFSVWFWMEKIFKQQLDFLFCFYGSYLKRKVQVN